MPAEAIRDARDGAPRRVGRALGRGLLCLVCVGLAVRTARASVDTNLGVAASGATVLGPLVVFSASDPSSQEAGPLQVFDARDRSVRNLGLASGEIGFCGEQLLVGVPEPSQGQDLNGDGDLEDAAVVHTFDPRSGRIRNLRLAVEGFPGDLLSPENCEDGLLAFGVLEFSQGRSDLNGDGDARDSVLHLLRVRTGEVQNTRLAVIRAASQVRFSGRRMLVLVAEESQAGTDLNRDGDARDRVVHVLDRATAQATNVGLATSLFTNPIGRNVGFVSVEEQAQGVDLNGDGDLEDSVPHRVLLRSGRSESVGIASTFILEIDPTRSFASLLVDESAEGNTDLNGDGDAQDAVLHLVDARTGALVNTGLTARNRIRFGSTGLAAVTLLETELGQDRNGDGDQDDAVLHILNGRTLGLRNTGLATSADSFPNTDVDGLFGVPVSEPQQRQDLNLDGDLEDVVLHVVNARTAAVQNTRLTPVLGLGDFQRPTQGRFAQLVREADLGGDRNGDADADDFVPAIFDGRTGRTQIVPIAPPVVPFPFVPGVPVFVPFLALNDVLLAIPVAETTSDLNGDGDTADLVLQLLDIASGAITNTARAIQNPGEGFLTPFFFGESDDAAIAFLVSEAEQAGVDLNRDGDIDDLVLHAASLEDRDRDGRFDFADDCMGGSRRCSPRR